MWRLLQRCSCTRVKTALARHGAAAVRTNVVRAPPCSHSALAAQQYGAQQNIPMLATLLEPCTKTVVLMLTVMTCAWASSYPPQRHREVSGRKRSFLSARLLRSACTTDNNRYTMLHILLERSARLWRLLQRCSCIQN